MKAMIHGIESRFAALIHHCARVAEPAAGPLRPTFPCMDQEAAREAATILARPFWALDVILLVATTIFLWWNLKGRK